jgi:hypothetical protein
MVDSAAAAAFNPIPDRMAGAVADNQFVEVVDGKPAIAVAVSETEVLKADAAATVQLDGSQATDALVVTDGANTETVDLSGHHTINTARNVSDDGRSGKITHASPVSATGEDTSVQSTSADNDLTVSRPFTATLSGNEDHSSFSFKPNLDQHASANPEISYIANPPQQHPADNLPHGAAQLADNGSPTVSDGAHPARPPFDGNQPGDFKFADDGGAHPGTGLHDPPPLTALSSDLSGDHPAHPFNPNSDHHASADPQIDDIAKDHPLHRPADNLPHGVAQLADNGSPAVTDDSHPVHPHFEESQPASFKFADDGGAHPGTGPHDPPALTALSSDLSGDHSAHPFSPNSYHHASADPQIDDIAKDHPLHRPPDNLPHGVAQFADNGSPAVTDDSHPVHPHFDGSQPASFKFADDGSAHPSTGPHDPPALTALSSDSSGDHPAHPFNPNSDHHASSDPKVNDIAKGLPQHPADNLPHGPAQLANNGSPGVSGDSFKFADDGSAHPGAGPHDPPPLTALSSDSSGDHPAHPFNPNSDHHASSDPETNDIAKALPQHAADNPHGPAQLANNGSPGVSGDSFKFADDGSAHPGAGPHDPSPLTALSSDSSGDHGPVAPALAQTFNAPGTTVSEAAPDHIGKDQFMFGKNFHDTIADLKPDMIETDHTTNAEIQHLLKNPTLDTNAVSTLNPTAPQDMTKVHLSHQGDLHFA